MFFDTVSNQNSFALSCVDAKQSVSYLYKTCSVLISIFTEHLAYE